MLSSASSGSFTACRPVAPTDWADPLGKHVPGEENALHVDAPLEYRSREGQVDFILTEAADSGDDSRTTLFYLDLSPHSSAPSKLR